MITTLRLFLVAVVLALPSRAFASDSPAASQPAQHPAAATGMSWPSAPPPPPPPTTHRTPGNIPPPPAGKGQVVFYRKKVFKGSFVSFMVREDGKELGKLGSGDYFVSTLEPGTHEFDVHSENHQKLRVDIEAGETCYVSGTVTMGVFVGRAHIDVANPLSFDMVFNDLKRSN